MCPVTCNQHSDGCEPYMSKLLGWTDFGVPLEHLCHSPVPLEYNDSHFRATIRAFGAPKIRKQLKTRCHLFLHCISSLSAFRLLQQQDGNKQTRTEKDSKKYPKMSTQSNLDSFFGVSKEKRVQKQSKLSFAPKQAKDKQEAKAEPNEEKKQGKKEKATFTNKEEEKIPAVTQEEKENQPDLMDTDDEDRQLKRAAKSQKSPNCKRPRKTYIEDDSEEEEEYQDSPEEDKDEVLPDGEEEEKLVKTFSTKAIKSVNDLLKNKSDAILKKKPSKLTTKSELAAHAMKSDKELLEDLPWTDHVSYAALCETMERIEEITARIEIQEILTELFRKILLRNPKDMYQLIYLASNSVAPAYECVELGVGDSILIKAIGEAYGTNPSIIKQKYEAEGDLGSVAKSSKGKQRMLGFGAEPKPLLAKEVLVLFREIASTTGAQSQKWKVDKIKKLLVRAQGPEAKYIIRGLQGKLRIGLAQSTVLISLAHAVTLTPPEGVDVDVKAAGQCLFVECIFSTCSPNSCFASL